jgi:hypothetical protein
MAPGGSPPGAFFFLRRHAFWDSKGRYWPVSTFIAAQQFGRDSEQEQTFMADSQSDTNDPYGLAAKRP